VIKNQRKPWKIIFSRNPCPIWSPCVCFAKLSCTPKDEETICTHNDSSQRECNADDQPHWALVFQSWGWSTYMHTCKLAYILFLITQNLRLNVKLCFTRKIAIHPSIQAGCRSGQPGLVVDNPALCRGVEIGWSLWSFSTQAILWFYSQRDSVKKLMREYIGQLSHLTFFFSFLAYFLVFMSLKLRVLRYWRMLI